MKRAFALTVVLLVVSLGAIACSSTTLSGAEVDAISAGAKLLFSQLIHQKCGADGKIGNTTCADLEGDADAMIDTLVGDVLKGGDVDSADRQQSRAAIAKLLVDKAGMTQHDADAIVNAIGDYLVYLITRRPHIAPPAAIGTFATTSTTS